MGPVENKEQGDGHTKCECVSVLNILQAETQLSAAYKKHMGFLGGSVVKNPPANAGDMGSIPGLGRSPGGGYSNSFQYSCMGSSKDRGVWWATVHGVIKSQTRLSN